MSERIVLLDPQGTLRAWKESLAPPDIEPEVVGRFEDLFRLSQDGPWGPSSMVVVLDGEPSSGLEPELATRILELVPDLPPIVLAVVTDPARGRAWTAAGAAAALLRPLHPSELRTEVERWLRFAERLKRSGRRLWALRKFFAMFAHDLKNPLSAISGYCELVLSHPLLPDQAREDLEKVRRNAELLSSMAQGLLEMVRGSARMRIAPREIDLKFVVTEAVEMMRVRASSRGIAIRLHAPASILVMVDPPRLIEALANILDNAIKFSPERSTIVVGVVRDHREAVITVDDEGPGIPPGEREGVFEKFTHATPGHQGGLGLGLSITRDIVHLHHGAIRVEGRSPQGTRIAIRLPFPEAVPVGAEPASRPPLAGGAEA